MADRELGRLEELAMAMSDSEESHSESEDEVEDVMDASNPLEAPAVGEALEADEAPAEDEAPVADEALAAYEASAALEDLEAFEEASKVPEDIEVLPVLETEESRLEALARQITDSEESEDEELEEEEEEVEVVETKDKATIKEVEKESSVKGETVESGVHFATLIHDIEVNADTCAIVLDEVEEDDAPGDISQEMDEQMSFVGIVSNDVSDIVEQVLDVNDPEEDYHEDADDVDDAAMESDSSSSDEELPKDFDSASDLCDNYLDHLNNMLRRLTGELDRNLKRQEAIEEHISELNMGQASKSYLAKSQHVSVSKKTLTVFGFPYFKDQNLFHPPSNVDTITKQSNKELDPWIENPRPFSKEEKKKLKEFVKEDALRRRLGPVREERESLVQRLRQTSLVEKEELEARLAATERRIREIKQLPEEKLFLDRFYSDYDWDRISVTNFNSLHTPRECELQWRNLVSEGVVQSYNIRHNN